METTEKNKTATLLFLVSALKTTCCATPLLKDERYGEEILQTAYCWARANILRKSASCEKVDFELIDNNLEQIKSQIDLFKTIRNNCTNINSASRKIEEVCEEIEDKIQQHLRNIHNEMQKGAEKESEI